MAKAKRVLVVGSGIAGLALAVALGRRDIAVDLVEIQPNWSILGTGISLTAPTLRALRDIGVIDACVQTAFGYDRIIFCDEAERQLGAVPIPRLAGPEYPPQVGISRAALHGALLAGIHDPGRTVRLGTTVAALDTRTDGVDVTFSDGRQASYDLVVGSDGVHSKVRHLAFDNVSPESFTGLAVWRATVPRAREVDCMQVFYGPRTKAGINPHSNTEMFLFLVEPIAHQRRIPDDQKHVVLTGLLQEFPGKLLTYVRDHVTDPRDVDYRPMSAFLLPSPWYRGRIVVIGDAAHTTTPHLATGAGIAIEDAVVLAELLASDLPIAEALDGFMTRRFDRCKLVVETAVKLGEMEKDKTIPVETHRELLAATFRQLAAPI